MPPAHIEPRIAPKLVNAMARRGWAFVRHFQHLLLLMIGLGMVDSFNNHYDDCTIRCDQNSGFSIYRGLVVPRQFMYSIYIIVCIDNLLTSRYNGFISANQYNGQHDGAIGTHQEHAHRGAHIVQLEFAKGA